MNETKNKKLIMYVIVTILIISIGVTLAYWVAGIQGEGTPMTFKAGELNIIFTDSAALTAEDIKPGWTISKTFSVENESTKPYSYNIIIKDMVNTFTVEKGLQYKITSTNGYNMTEYKDVPKASGKVVLAYNIEVPGGVIQNYTIEFRYYDDPDVDQSEDMGKEFSGAMFIEEGTLDPNRLSEQLRLKYETVLIRSNFDSIIASETATTGTIYKTTEEWETEDGSIVYYFAGNVNDNWVKFGKDKDDAELYWRIIRTNEDGSVRLLYAGTSPNLKKGYLINGEVETYAYNKTYNNTMYVGYMYGTTGSLENNRSNTTDSTIKTEIDTWYARGLNVKTDTSGKTYDTYVSKTAIYCNDRSTVDYQASGYMYYGVYNRLLHNNQVGRKATYRCGYNPVDTYRVSVSGNTWGSTGVGMHANANIADKFSASTVGGGNGNLEYPVALMTADEVAYAGNLINTNGYNIKSWYLLNSDTTWWTMSPYAYDNHASITDIDISSTAIPDSWKNKNVSSTKAIRPVLSIKSCATILGGNGTSSSPYEISVDETCANAVN